MQYPLGLSPEMRNQLNYIYIGQEDSYSNKSRLYYHYANIYPSLHDFNCIMNKLQDRQFLIIKNDLVADKIFDKVKIYVTHDITENINLTNMKIVAYPKHNSSDNVKLLNIIIDAHETLVKSIFNNTHSTKQLDLLKLVVNKNQSLIDYLINSNKIIPKQK